MAIKKKDFRARMPHWFAEFASPIKKMGYKAFSQIFYKGNGQEKGEQSRDETNNKVNLLYKGRRSITSLQQAIEFFEIDLDRYEVERFVTNSWDVTNGEGETFTNYQVKVFLKKYDEDTLILLEDMKLYLNNEAKKIKVKEVEGNGVGVAALTDFHIGADVRNMIKTKDFNVRVLIEYLHRAAQKINARNYKDVYVCLLGDYVHSISGLMHLTDWQELGYGQYGASVIILATQLIRDHLLSKINNLRGIYMVSGNHDRLSASYKGDPKGEGAMLIHYNLKRDFPSIPVEYNPVLLTTEIDGIFYLLSHGHHKLTEKENSNLLFQYGKQGLFNVLLRGHKHTNIEKGRRKVKTVKYEDYYITQLDDMSCRLINVPSIYTGDLYSESSGYTANGGFTLIENNGKGLINQTNFAL